MQLLATLFPEPRGRIPRSHSFWDGKKKAFGITITVTFVLLQLLFLGNLSYLYGSLFRDTEKTHNLNILMVDYDQGILGQSLAAAVEQLSADTFPGMHSHTVQQYPDPSDVVRTVRDGNYWGAIYTHPGASERLAAAFQGGSAATNYNTSDVVTYVFNGARYPTVEQGFVQANMETLISVMRIAYNNINGTAVLRSGSIVDETAAQILLNPFVTTYTNVKPTEQGTRVLLNTVTMILPIIQQFFFLMALNGISAQFKFYRHLPIKHNAAIRLILGLSYTFMGSLCMTGYIWAFRENWDVSGGQFMLTWMLCWLFMQINFLVMDVATGFIPPSFLSFFVLTWAIMNVTSTIFPFELNAGFYHWGYFFPAHSAWETLVNIWSGGGYHKLYRSLPILFAWWVVLIPLAVSAMHWRCTKAVREDEARDLAMNVAANDADTTDKEELSDYARRPSSERDDGLSRAHMAGHNPHMPMPFGEAMARIGSN